MSDLPPLPNDTVTSNAPRVVIVGENASTKYGGESILPLHYFQFLRSAGIETWLVVHDRNRDYLKATISALDYSRIYFASETMVQKWFWRLTKKIEYGRLRTFIVEPISLFLTQVKQRRIIRRLVPQVGATVVHQPTPVSPTYPSWICGLGVPVVIGPMNGGMQYPPAFKGRQSVFERCAFWIARSVSPLINGLVPGKRRAAVLLVANERTRLALPKGLPPPVVQLAENGIDVRIWRGYSVAPNTKSTPSCGRFIFMGRLIALKSVDLLLHAIAVTKSSSQPAITLDIVGHGPARRQLEILAGQLGIEEDVTFHGFKSQTECALLIESSDAMVLPSLRECGGAVVLEAMAMGKAVIAANWGGPADYLDETCGILVAPSGRQEVIEGFAEAMIKLINEPKLKVSLGQAGKEKVTAQFDWRIKINRILEIYEQAIATNNQQAN